MKDLGLSHEGFDVEYKPEVKPKIWKNTLATVYSVIFSKRTERATRYTLCLIFPLIIFYYKMFDMNFLYACPLIYLLMSSLIPPRMAGISLVSTMFHLGVLLSMAWATLMGVVVLSSYFSTNNKVEAVLLFLIFVISIASFKIGKTAELTNTLATISCYVCVLAFFNIYPFLANGVNFEIFISDLLSRILENRQAAEKIITTLPKELQQLIMKLLSAPPGSVPSFEPIVAKIQIPYEIVKLIPNSSRIVGKEADLIISSKSIRIALPPGSYLIDLMWSGTGHLGGIRPLYISAIIAMGFFFLSLLIPPQRFSRFFVQYSLKTLLGHALRTLCNAVSAEKNTCFFFFCSENASTYFSTAERYVEMFTEDELRNQGLMEKVEGKFVKASLEEFDMQNQFSLSKDIILTESISSLAKQSVMEISFLKPGVLYWFSTKWEPLIEEVTRIIIHAYNIQKLFKENVDDKTLTSYNVMLRALSLDGLRLTQSINTGNLNTWIMNSGTPFKNYIHSGTMVYHINLKMLTPVSFFTDCKRHNGRHFCSVLEKATTELQERYGSSDEPFLYLLDKAESWEEKVLYLGIAWELKNITRDCALALSKKVNDLTHAMEINKKPQNILYNLLAFFSSMFLLIFIYCNGIIFLFSPWKWTWKTTEPWIFTKLPWYRSHRLLYCLQWIFGVTLLFFILTFDDSIRIWRVDNGLPYRISIVFIEGMTTKVSSWSILAFLTTFYATYEGTFRRSILRLLGMFGGSIMGFLCITIFGKSNKIPQIIWVILTTFIVCFIGANSKNPLLGFDPSWGYACQFFMYQQGIIIFESFAELQTVKELFFSRVIAHLVGVGIAILISFLVFPTSAENCLGSLVKQVLYAIHEGLLYKSHQTSRTRNSNYKQISSEEQEQHILTNGNTDHTASSFYPQTKSLSNTNVYQDKPRFFDNLIDEALEHICYYEREISILSELSLPFTNQALRRSIISIKIIIYRHRLFREFFHTAVQNCSASFCEMIHKLLLDMNSVIEFLNKKLVYHNGSYYWYSGYLSFFTGRKWKRPNSKKNLEEFKILLEPIKEKLEEFGNLPKNDIQEFYAQNLRHLDLTEKSIAELFVAYVIRAYLIDILQFTNDLCDL